MYMLSLLLVLTMFSSTSYAADQRFKDVPSTHWAASAIHEMVKQKVMSGRDEHTFQPNELVTRGEMAKHLAIAAGLSDADFKQQNLNLDAQPEQPVTREQFAVAAAKLKGIEPTDEVIEKVKAKTPDYDLISEEAQPYVAAALYNGLIRPYKDFSFKPDGNLSRAEAAFLIWHGFYDGVVSEDQDEAAASEDEEELELSEVPFEVRAVHLNGPTAPLLPKQTFQLRPEVKTSFNMSTPFSISYTSSNVKVATVNDKGLITAIAAGTTVITASVEDKSAKITVRVQAANAVLKPGLWVEKAKIQKTRSQLLASGAKYFELKSYKNGVLQGTFTSVSAAPANRIASVDLKLKLTNNKASFSYKDDGWYNSGKGTVELKGNTIVFTFKETKADEMANWNLGTFTTVLYPSTAKESSTAAKTQSYSNARFGFQVQFPAEWKSSQESANGDGKALNDGSANVVLAYASHYMEEFKPDLKGFTAIKLSTGEKAYKLIKKSDGGVTIHLVCIADGIQYQIFGHVTESFYNKYKTQIEKMISSFKIIDGLEN